VYLARISIVYLARIFILKESQTNNTFQLRNRTTIRNTALLKKLIISQIFKKFPARHGTWRFIMFTRLRHFSLSWCIPIQSKPLQPISLRSILISSSH
jgi:hypothetical protein